MGISCNHGDAITGTGNLIRFCRFLFEEWEKSVRFAKKNNRYGEKGENT